MDVNNAQVEIRLNMGEDIDQLEPPKFWRSLYTITIFLHKLSTLPSFVNFDLFHFEKKSFINLLNVLKDSLTARYIGLLLGTI